MPSALSFGRLIQNGKSSPARNMAVDEALLRHVTQPVLRIYEWDVPCVSLGYFQKSSLLKEGRTFVRRYTGGGLVEHGRDLTYTLVLPADHPLTTAGTLPSYLKIHQAVAEALTACGISCHLATAQPQKDDPSCFLKPVPADVLDSAEKKLAGAAQRRTKQGCLHQGSILLPDPIPLSLPDQIIQKLGKCLGTSMEPSSISPEELRSAAELESTRYATREWNYCR